MTKAITAARAAKRAPIVRLPPKSGFEIVLTRAAQVSIVFMGTVAFFFALVVAEYILAPISLGIVIGLMLGPVANRLEARGLPSGATAIIIVLLFIVVLSLVAAAVVGPLSFWVDRLPQIWDNLRLQLTELKGPLESIKDMRNQLRDLTGGEGVTVSVDEGVGGGVESVAAVAPAVIAQILLFFASLYFFVATRNKTRTAVLKLCFDRRLRWRVAHVFRDVERLVSRYLLSISLINIMEGVAVGIGLWLIGVPSAALWAAIAAVTNFVPFIGPAIMVVVLLGIGLTEFETFGGSLLPVAVYLSINVLEAQFVTPMVIGRTMTLNPFVVLLALVFWIWLWGPIGGFIAVPALLIGYAIVRNIVPGTAWAGEDLR